ncbi:hypothetical protein C1645_778161 [Glomus cerebriforme]|uniref:Uncharacterized protein n=1 Tax=Glomus cerebriforme TaxID=658196 RepID=A0A397SQ67_9GLOM|nr:hypothetical protein C1645_778161 [Glomus cerebriforme]
MNFIYSICQLLVDILFFWRGSFPQYTSYFTNYSHVESTFTSCLFMNISSTDKERIRRSFWSSER